MMFESVNIEHGVIGSVVSALLFSIRWLFKENRKLRQELDTAHKEQREDLFDRLREANSRLIAMQTLNETMRGIRDKPSCSRKVVSDESER